MKKRRKSQAVPQMKGRRQQELYEIYGMGDIEHTVVKQCLYILPYLVSIDELERLAEFVRL